MKSLYVQHIKRLLDVVFSAVLLVILSPLLAVVAFLVRVKLGSPVIYRQERPGKDEKIFSLYKFRTMTNERDQAGILLPDEDRLTSFGRMLRQTSLDEIPELANIFKGDMSFIGPRPLLVRYLDRYNAIQARRHDVRPGLTGLAQINGRNAIGWPRKFEYDVEYVNKVCFVLDAKIFFSTIRIVARKEGISESGEATMSEFMGEDS